MATTEDNNGDDTTEVHVTVPKDDTPEPIVEAGDTTVVVTNPDDNGETDRAVDTAVELTELRHQLEMVSGELATSRAEAEAAAALALAAAEEVVTEPEPEPKPEPMPEDVPPGRVGHWLTRTFADWRN